MNYYSSLLLLTSLVVSSYASSTVDILNDITTISHELSTLNASIFAFPASGGSAANALSIHTQAETLDGSINTAAMDVTNVVPSNISEINGDTIISVAEGVTPIILSALQEIVVKKPAFDGLPVGGVGALLKQDLINLNASTFAFEAALIAAVPSDLKSIAQRCKATVDAAFATAIAGYANP